MDENITPEMIQAGCTGWSCGNSYWYAVRGVDKLRQRIIRGHTHSEKCKEILAALNGIGSAALGFQCTSDNGEQEPVIEQGTSSQSLGTSTSLAHVSENEEATISYSLQDCREDQT